MTEVEKRIQALVAEKYQKRVSVFRFVDNVRLSDIQSDETKQMVTNMILESELLAKRKRVQTLLRELDPEPAAP